jgi:hypothetical protein
VIVTTASQSTRQKGANTVRDCATFSNRAPQLTLPARRAREHRAAWTVGNALAVEFFTKTRPLAATSLIGVATRYFFFLISSIVQV